MTAPDRHPEFAIAQRPADAHKGDFGRCLLVGGARGMAGSISLSAMAALRVGAGLVTVAVPDRCLETVASFCPAIMTMPLDDDETGAFSQTAASQLADNSASNKFDVVGCGPGITTRPGAVQVVMCLLQDPPPALVVDADALNVIAAERFLWDWEGAGMRCVLTPHPGELARLTGVPASDRAGQINAAEDLAGRTGVVFVVKGGPTVVVDGKNRWTNETGNPGMATAGCGDVLTGMISGLLGMRDPSSRLDRLPLYSAWQAARLAVHWHGTAGDRAAKRLGTGGMLATDVIDEIPFVGRELELKN